MTDSVGYVGFAIGTGRCGTEFITRLVELEPDAVASHERNAFSEAFQRYCSWYGLRVDTEGFLWELEREIETDLTRATLSFESSAYLSLSVQELHERFGAKFLLLVRSPERVVNSYLHKGWYCQRVAREDPNRAPGYQSYPHAHHTFSRIVPSGEEFLRWRTLGRVGKLAWYWNALNTAVVEQFAAIPAESWRVQKLEDLDYSAYGEIASFMGLRSRVSRDDFTSTAKRRPNAFQRVPTIADWSDRDIREFEEAVAPMALHFGYEYRVAALPLPEPRVEAGSVMSRAKAIVRRKVRAIADAAR